MKWVWLKILGLMLFLLIITSKLYAQDFQPLLFEFIPKTNISNSSNSSQNLKLQITRLSVGEVIPTIYCREHSQILYGIRYDLLYLNFDNWTFSSNKPEYLHFLRNELTVIQDINDHWKITGLLNLGLATDLKKKINWDDAHIHTYVSISNNFPELGYGFGVTYTSYFGSPILLPVIQAYWKPSEFFRFEMFLPKNISFWYVPNKNSEVGIKSVIYGNRYHLGEFTTNEEDADLHYSIITIGPSIKYRIFSCFLLYLETGYTLHRRLEIANKTFSEKLNPDNNYYLRAGLVFRPRR